MMNLTERKEMSKPGNTQAEASARGLIYLSEAVKAKKALMLIETTKAKIRVNQMDHKEVVEALKANGFTAKDWSNL